MSAVNLSLDFETTNNLENLNIYVWGLLIKEEDFKHKNGNNQYSYTFNTFIFKQNRKFINYNKHNEYIFIYGTTLDILFKLLMSSTRSLNIIMQNGARFDLYFINAYLKKNKQFTETIKYSPVPFKIYTDKLKNNLLIESSLINYVTQIKKMYNTRLKKLKLYYPDKTDEEIIKYYNYLTPYDFTSLLDPSKRYIIYNICLPSKRYKSKRYNIIKFWDCYAQFPSSLALKGEELGDKKLNKKDNYQKRNTYNNIQEFENDKGEYDYLLRDCEITLIHTLKNYQSLKEVSKSFKIKATAGSIAYNIWKQEFILYKVKQYQKDKLISPLCYFTKRGNKKTAGREGYGVLDEGFKKFLNLSMSKKWFDRDELFNAIFKKELPTNFLNDWDTKFKIHQYYSGGLTLLNEDYRGYPFKDKTKKLYYYDVNSSYPYSMQSDEKAPYGEPLDINKKEVYKILSNKKYYVFFKLTPKEVVHSPDSLPFLYQIGKYNSRDITNKLELHTEYITNSTELPRILKYYATNSLTEFLKKFNVHIDFVFNTQPINYYFKDYIKKLYTLKQNAKSLSIKQVIKLLMNSLYGKFGTKTNKDSYFYDENDGFIPFYSEYKQEFYFPLACVITSIARMILVDNVGWKYKKLVYCDTDSLIFYLNTEENKNLKINIHPDNLGAFKLEGVFDTGLFRRPKQYMLINKENKFIKAVFAGINFDREQAFYNLSSWDYFNNICTVENFFHGMEVKNQPNSVKLPNGVIIKDIIKNIRPIYDYKRNELKKDQYIITKEQFEKRFNSSYL